MFGNRSLGSLSSNRFKSFEFGTGRGSSTTEQAGFGIDDPELTKAMFDEALPQIVRMWQEDDYSYEGRFFSMPPRNVLPKPLTRPHWRTGAGPSRSPRR